MGWTYQTNYNGYSPKQFWINKFLPEIESYSNGRLQVVDQCGKGKDFYAAIKNNETGKTFAIVVLIEKEGNEIGYKEIGEDSMPYYFKATKKLISKLSPTDSEYANEWRNRCLGKIR